MPIRQTSPTLPRSSHTLCCILHSFSLLDYCSSPWSSVDHTELIDHPPSTFRSPGLPCLPSTHVGASIGVSIACACSATAHTVTTDHEARPSEALLPAAPKQLPSKPRPSSAATSTSYSACLCLPGAERGNTGQEGAWSIYCRACDTCVR